MDGFHDSICTSSICSLRAFYARVWFIIRHGEVAFYRMWKEVRADLKPSIGMHGNDQFRTSQTASHRNARLSLTNICTPN
jgi:hypothetical protein